MIAAHILENVENAHHFEVTPVVGFGKTYGQVLGVYGICHGVFFPGVFGDDEYNGPISAALAVSVKFLFVF